VSGARHDGKNEGGMSEELRSLQDLTQMILDAELTKLRQLSQETRRRQDEIARLGAALAARSAEVKRADPSNDLALRTGQDARWQAWVARTNSRLTREAADVAARREAQRLTAQRAFGRVHALGKIREREDEENRLRVSRQVRVETGGPGKTG